jgi:UDP-glucose 4-epimerase
MRLPWGAERVQVRHLDARPGDVRHSLGDIRKTRELLGYEPSVDFERGLEQVVRFASQS